MDDDATPLSQVLGPAGWAECHGTLAGALAAGLAPQAAASVAAQAGSGADPSALVPWAESLTRGLADAQGGFRLELPADEASLTQRVDALAAWVRGFLSGVGHAGERVASAGGEAQEALEDLAAIARGAEVTDEGSEEEEEAFTELVEYLRVVVQYLFEALNPLPPSPRGKMNA